MKIPVSDLIGKRPSLCLGTSKASVRQTNRRNKRAAQAAKMAIRQIELQQATQRQREADDNREIERLRIEERRRFREQRAEEQRRQTSDGEVSELEENIARMAREFEEKTQKERQDEQRA